MVEESVFRGMLGFLTEIGIFDVILPFILIFTIVFAILDKTKILGVERIEGQEITKKNLNAMVAFVISFLVIASAQLVAVINEVMANIVLLLILAISFLMLVGVFFGDKEFTLKDYPKWIKFFMVFMFIGISIIFLNALKFGENTWLEVILSPLSFWPAEGASAIIFIVIVIAFMAYVTRDPVPKTTTTKKE